MLISRNPSSQDFSVENLRKTICNLFEVSNACMTLQIKELALNGQEKKQLTDQKFDGASDDIFMVQLFELSTHI